MKGTEPFMNAYCKNEIKSKCCATVKNSTEFKRTEECSILDKGTFHNKEVIMSKNLFKYVI